MKSFCSILIPLLLSLPLLSCSQTSSEQSSISSQDSSLVMLRQAEQAAITNVTGVIEPNAKVEYKQINDTSLSLHIFNPKNHSIDNKTAAIVFFHGGGWNQGHPSHFYRQSQHLANRGMVAISAEYRVKEKHGTDPRASLMDAKSAMRYVRANANKLGIDPNRIAAGGGSAGGHIATGTATATKFEDENDDKSISYRPDLLVLFNPVFDNSSNGYGHQQVKDYWQQFSPLHNITAETPPGIGFFAEKDTAIKAFAAVDFKNKMAAFGTSFELKLYKNQTHGFFNEAKFTETIMEMDKFLTIHEYLPALTPTTYYIDAKKGDDKNSGSTIDSPWSSLAKVNQTFFLPGDKILFKSNTQYSGVLEPKGSGTKNAPINMASYGKGAKPVINGWGKKLHTLLLNNVEHWKVSNLAITNKGKKRQARRTGITIKAINAGELHNIELSNLEIYHVNGSLVKKEGGGAAILIRNGGDVYPTRFIGLKITNNHIHHSGRNGISFHGNSRRDKWFPNLGVHVKGNLIEQVPGDGIVVIASDGAIIEHNILRDFPDTLPKGDAAAGIWPWSADNTIIQFNEVSGHKAKWDGQGFDADFNSFGTIIQYNYSHDNYGGFLLVCNKGQSLGQNTNKGTVDTIIRGNVSINDGIRPYPTHAGVFSPTFHISGPVENTHIYNNIIIVPKKPKGVDATLIDIDNWGGPWPVNTLFENNQFYFEDEIAIKHKDIKSFVFKQNHLSKPIHGISNNDNYISTNNQFNLKELKRMALNTLKEYKNNE